MRPGGGKAKGASFEREICVMLSRWVSNGVSGDIFWRSAMSGGRATVAFKKSGDLHSSQVGDISCISPAGNAFIDAFAVECKFYKDLEYTGLLTGKGKLLTFWREIQDQAKTHGKLPFLVARQNRMNPHICVSEDGLYRLNLRDWDTLLISVKFDLYLLNTALFCSKAKLV